MTHTTHPSRATPRPLTRAGRVMFAACTAVALMACGLSPALAHAGEWVQVSCVNPDGSAAGSNGWVPMVAGGGYGSNADTACGPGTPMWAILSADVAVGSGSAQTLRYIPPADSTLNGGEVTVALFADGGGYDASGTAVLYSPEYVYDSSSVFFQCAAGLTPCSGGGNDFSGTLAIPTGRGGELYVSAGCGGTQTAVCNEHPSHGAWSLVELSSGILRLRNSATPAASSITGTLLEGDARGTRGLVIAASDPGGPGIYNVTVKADGRTLYSATPDTNEGRCVPVGASGGALMFDAGQPCKQSEQVDMAIDTSSLTDGAHTLTASVTDAAGNTSVVLDRAITTENGSPADTVSPGLLNGNGASETARIRLDDRTTLARPYTNRALNITGHLEGAPGTPIVGARLDITQDPAGALSATRMPAVTTSGDGSFTVHVPPGPSRAITVGYRARSSDTAFAAEASVKEAVRAGVHIVISPRGTTSAGTITIDGTVAGPLPHGGLTAELLVHYRGRWEPFRDAHVARSGHFRVRYQFQGATGRFPFRARVIGEQGGFPYATGESNTVQVSTR